MNAEPIIHRKKRRIVIVAPQATMAPKESAALAVKAAPAKQQEKPLSAKERRARRTAKARAALAVLAEHYPHLFDTKPRRPLAVGILYDLHAERKAGRLPLGHDPLKAALEFWTDKLSYLEALAAGGPRFDLAGEPKGEVKPEHSAWAAARRDDLIQRIAKARSA